MKKILLLTSFASLTALMAALQPSDSYAENESEILISDPVSSLPQPLESLIEAIGLHHDTNLLENSMLTAQTKPFYLDYTMDTNNATATKNVDALPSLDTLELQILFHTGVDTLSTRGIKKIAVLSEFLLAHPSLSIRLTGHADPRGTDEYNNVLSEHRALSVQHELENHGVASDRIERRAYGALQSHSPKGNYAAYAQDRRVDIEVFSTEVDQSLAQVPLN